MSKTTVMWLAAVAATMTISMRSADADVVSDFTGYYAVSNWTETANGDGVVSTLGAPTSISLTSGNSGNNPDFVDFTITAAGDDIWSFDWVNNGADPGWESSFYLMNGTPTQIYNGGSPFSGTVSLAVNRGDVIGFRNSANDGIFGPSILTITNFSGPVVPEPSSVLSLLSVCGLYLAAYRRRRTKSTA